MDGFFSDYGARLHSLAFTFVPVAQKTHFNGESKGSSAHRQNQIRVRYRTASRFEFADGHRLTGLDPGNHSIRLLGAQLPFVVTQHLRGTTLSVDRVAVDAEGLAMKADGSGWFSEEYGPNIYRFDRDLRITRVIVPPEDYQPHDSSGTLAFTSVADPVRGRRMNQGFEGLGLNASETRLFTLLQSALIQDCGKTLESRRHARLLVYDVSHDDAPARPIGEYVLPLPVFDETGMESPPNKTATQSELVVLNDTQLLVLCRDASGLGSSSTNASVFKSVLLVDIKGATNLADPSSQRATSAVSPSGKLLSGIKPAVWGEAIDLLSRTDHRRFGFNSRTCPPDRFTFSEKWEGMALVSALDATKPDDFFLFVANDNDFMTSRGRMRQADGLVRTYDAIGTNGLRGEHDTVFLAYRLTIRLGNHELPASP
jgi:hypothetical protein